MNTILPNSFDFNNGKVLTPDRINTHDTSIFLIQHYREILTIGIVTFFIGFILYLIVTTSDLSDTADTICSVSSVVALIIGFVLISVMLLGFGSGGEQHKFNNNCEFSLQPNSNLIVKQDTSSGNHPITGKENKSYPYKVYVRNNISNELVYLGGATHDRVFLNDKTTAGKLFIKYNQYINEHNLRDKFTNTFKFERDASIKDADGLPQYVLKGDGITLKAKSFEKQKYQVYVDKD